MSETPDYYAALSLQPAATPEQIKQAYRAAAKRAHPDAGGNTTAMERVNEAYRVLSDPASRQAYDRLHAAEAADDEMPYPAAAAHARQAAHEARETRLRAELHHRMRLAQARASAWRILRDNAIAAVLLQILTRVLTTQTSDDPTQFWLAVAGFAPLYGLILGIIFLFSPQIRLDFHDLAYYAVHRTHNPHPTKTELITLAILVLGFIPLAITWALIVSTR